VGNDSQKRIDLILEEFFVLCFSLARPRFFFKLHHCSAAVRIFNHNYPKAEKKKHSKKTEIGQAHVHRTYVSEI
jgi:hypothetical protein